MRNLNGLIVTLETTTGPGSYRFMGRTTSRPPYPVAKGRTRLTLYVKAVNSTKRTLAEGVDLGGPRVYDAAGAWLEGIAGEWRVTGSAGGHPRATKGLKPGGLVESIQAFDLTPQQRPLKVIWAFAGIGTATFIVP